MELFRIAKAKRIDDLSGEGARIYGGRWNDKGVAIIYTSESRALAALEYLVHTPMVIAPANLSIIRLTLPDSIVPQQISISSLPSNWRDYPPPQAIAKIGTNWALENRSLLLRVPSVVVEQEFNVLINPRHPDFNLIVQSDAKPFFFDPRILAKIQNNSSLQ